MPPRVIVGIAGSSASGKSTLASALATALQRLHQRRVLILTTDSVYAERPIARTHLLFCAVLLIAAILSAPWSVLWGAALALGVSSVAALAYALLVVGRARRQTAYVPVLEDWIWHNVLPLIA